MRVTWYIIIYNHWYLSWMVVPFCPLTSFRRTENSSYWMHFDIFFYKVSSLAASILHPIRSNFPPRIGSSVSSALHRAIFTCIPQVFCEGCWLIRPYMSWASFRWRWGQGEQRGPEVERDILGFQEMSPFWGDKAWRTQWLKNLPGRDIFNHASICG